MIKSRRILMKRQAWILQKTPAFYSFMPMFFYQSNGNRFLSSLDWFPILVYLNGSFYLYIIDIPYRIYFYTLHTRPYLSYILRFPVKGVKGGSVFVLLAWPKSTKNSRSYSFFCLDAKEPKNQGCVCWATPSLRYAVRAANSLRSDSDAPAASLRSYA